MDSYIVRVYRRDEEDHSPSRGVVEQIGAVRQEVFSTMEELWEILSGISKKPARRGKEKQE